MAHEAKGAGFTARVTTQFRGCRDDERHVTVFNAGDQVTGELAKVAISQGWAKSIGAAPENKASEVGQGPFPTGQERPLSSRQAAPAKTKATSKRRAARRS